MNIFHHMSGAYCFNKQNQQKVALKICFLMFSMPGHTVELKFTYDLLGEVNKAADSLTKVLQLPCLALPCLDHYGAEEVGNEESH